MDTGTCTNRRKDSETKDNLLIVPRGLPYWDLATGPFVWEIQGIVLLMNSLRIE